MSANVLNFFKNFNEKNDGIIAIIRAEITGTLKLGSCVIRESKNPDSDFWIQLKSYKDEGEEGKYWNYVYPDKETKEKMEDIVRSSINYYDFNTKGSQKVEFSDKEVIRMNYKPTEIVVDSNGNGVFQPNNGIYGYCDLTVEGNFKVSQIKLRKTKEGDFYLEFPRKIITDRNGQELKNEAGRRIFQYYAYPIEQEIRDELLNAVLDEYHKYSQQPQQH
ncbi:septation protein SpoVG family protein [Ileibacterium valens]|uniref:septation protein SpoVG family protein n=1 Tax=Ileibacterium valens TaxID=1862668 RepID=UPI0025702303|nr:septation protein SpoVG family protein [Ileibacterium valens]